MSTAKGPLIASEKYFEWSLYFGENITFIGFGDYVVNSYPYRKLLMLGVERDYMPGAWIIG